MFSKKMAVKLTVDEMDALASAIYTQIEAITKAKMASEEKREIRLLKSVLKKLGR